MRALSPTMSTVLAGAHLDSAWLLEIQWPDGSTGRYADRTVLVDADTYVAAVARWLPLEVADAGTVPAWTVGLVAEEAGALWADLRGRDSAGAVVRIGVYAVGTAGADVVWLIGGDLASVENQPDGTSRLHLQSILASLSPVLPVHAVDLTTFPDAPPASVGRVLPVVYGTVAPLPAVPVQAAAVTRLQGSMAAASTSFDVEDAASPPAFPAGSITLRIDDEYVVGSFSGNTFAVTTRGAHAVTAATADSGTSTSLVDAVRIEPDAAWVGFVLIMTGGTSANVGLERVIAAFDSATQTLSVDYAFPEPIAGGDTYDITTRAADHLHGALVELVAGPHVFVVADHACVAVTDVRLDGTVLPAADVRVDRNDTTTFPSLGRSLTTIATRGRPRVKRFAEGSRFLLARFDADGGSSAGVAWGNAIDPRPTFVAQINGTQPVLALQQTTDLGDGPARYGDLRRVFLVVHFRQDRELVDDVVEVEWNGQLLGTLDPTQPIDHTGAGGEVDLVHTHPQDLSHPVAPIARTHEHQLPGQVRQVDTDTETGNAFSSTNPKTLSRSSTPPHSTDEIIQATIARLTITITSTPSGFNPVGIFRLHYRLPYGAFLTRDSFNGVLTLNVTSNITGFLNQWANWPNAFNRFQFWVENVAASQIVVETFTGLWEVTIAPRLSQPSTTFLETEMTVLPEVSLDGTMAPVQNAEELLSIVYENIFDVSTQVGGSWSALNDAIALARYVVNGTDDATQMYIASVHLDVEFAPFTYVSDGLLTATVSGVDDQGDGTGVLVTNPADVVQDLLTVRLGLAPARVDGAAFVQAAADAAAQGARVDFALTRAEPMLPLVHRVAAEGGGSLAVASGTVGVRIRQDLDAPPTAVLTAATRADAPAPVDRPGVAAVANVHALLYAEDYGAESGGPRSFGQSVVVENAASIATYQRRVRTDRLRHVRDAAWAAALAAERLDEAAWPPVDCRWPAYWQHLAVERGDVVWLTDAQVGLVDAPGRVMAERYAPGSWQERRLDAAAYVVRLAPWRLLRVFDPATWLVWSRDGLRYVIDGTTVARITMTGDWWIAGRFVRHAVLAAGSTTEFETYDAASLTLYYSAPSGARLLEIDGSGDVRVAGVEEINALLGTGAGPEGTARSGSEVRWVRGGIAPDFTLLATLTATRWRLAGRIIQHGVFPNLP